MSLDKIYGIAGTALNAQLTRMNLTASNLANQGTVNTTESEAFRAKRPVFKAILSHEMATPGAPYVGGCLLYTSPSPRDKRQSRMPSSA